MGPRIIIAGGGIGGTAAALALHRAGFPVTLFEQSAAFAEVGAGMSLCRTPRGCSRHSGVLDRVAALGEPVNEFQLLRPDGRVISTLNMGGFATPALCLRRADLHRCLRDPLPPDRLEVATGRPRREEGGGAPALPGLHGPIPALIESTEQLIMKNDARDRHPLRRWGEGRVTLLGDAAHPITPNVGQGAGMAIEDAACLAKALLATPNVPAACRAYEAMRMRRTRSVGRQARRIGAIGQWENRWMVAARNLVTRLVPAQAGEMRLNSV